MAIKEMIEIELLAPRRRGKERKNTIQAAEKDTFQRGPKEARKKGNVIEIGTMTETGDEMGVLLSHLLFRISMALTFLP